MDVILYQCSLYVVCWTTSLLQDLDWCSDVILYQCSLYVEQVTISILSCTFYFLFVSYLLVS